MSGSNNMTQSGLHSVGMEDELLSRSRRIACTACRQNKSRCEKDEKDDGPCLRCRRQSLPCHEDPFFRRASKSRQIEELERQVRTCVAAINRSRGQDLPAYDSQGSFSLDETSQAAPGAAFELVGGLGKTSFADSITLSSMAQPRESLSMPEASTLYQTPFTAWVSNTQSNAVSPPVLRPAAFAVRRLGVIEFGQTDIDALFETFFEHYHPFLPFLDPSRSPDDYFTQSAILFWAVIAVASRRHEQDVTLLRFLALPVSKLVWETVPSFPSNLFTVQALLLLCTWPFPTSSLWQEPTTVWSAMAVSMAQQLGLPGPDLAGEFSRVRPSSDSLLGEERLRTWAACVIVAQNTNASFGTLPTASYCLTTPFPQEEEEYIQQVPHNLQQQLIIGRFCHRLSRSLCVLFSRNTSFATIPNPGDLLPPLEMELSAIEQTLIVSSELNRFHLLSAKFFLYVHYFYLPWSANGRKRGILQAYAVAQDLIAQVRNMDKQFDFLKYITGFLFRTIFMATCAVWKVLHSNYYIEVDPAAGRACFNSAIGALHKCSVENNDNAGRQSEILVQLWKGGESDLERYRTSEPSLTYKARYGASLAYDCLFYWRDKIGGQRINGLHVSATIPIDGIREARRSLSDPQPVAFSNEVFMGDEQGFAPGEMLSGSWDF